MKRIKNWFLIRFWPIRLAKRLSDNISRKLFLLEQYKGTQKRIWGLEYSIESLKEAREIVRREHDKITETIDAAKIAYEKSTEQSEKDKWSTAIEAKSKDLEEINKRIDLSDQSISETQDQIDSFYDHLPRLIKKLDE